MAKNLCDFSLKRNWKEALVFYLAYLVLGMLISGFVGVIFGLINPGITIETTMKIGTIVGTIYHIIIYFTVYIKKGMNSFKYVLIGTIAAILNIFIGLIISLLFVAYLTTRDSEIKTDKTEV